MHELHHVLLGHTPVSGALPRIIAFDAGSTRCWWRAFSRHLPLLLLELYGRGRTVALLAPPAGAPITTSVLRTSTVFYGGSSMTAEEVFNAITDTVEAKDWLLNPTSARRCGPDEGTGAPMALWTRVRPRHPSNCR